LTLVELRAEWRRLLGTQPPSLRRDLITRAIAYTQARGERGRASDIRLIFKRYLAFGSLPALQRELRQRVVVT
jgi:hypothetical protein